MKVTIQKISRQQKTSQKTGKAFTSVGIMIDGKWWNGFGGKWNADWKDGDVVNVNLVQNGEYRNFEQIDPVNEIAAVIQELTSRVSALEAALFKGITPKPMPIAPAPRMSPKDQYSNAGYSDLNPPPPGDDDYAGYMGGR